MVKKKKELKSKCFTVCLFLSGEIAPAERPLSGGTAEGVNQLVSAPFWVSAALQHITEVRGQALTHSTRLVSQPTSAPPVAVVA